MTTWSRLGFDPTLARDWADGTALFNRLSGETHVLNPLAISALALIDRESTSTEHLSAALLRAYPETDRAALDAELHDLLHEMERLGLIASARS